MPFYSRWPISGASVSLTQVESELALIVSSRFGVKPRNSNLIASINSDSSSKSYRFTSEVVGIAQHKICSEYFQVNGTKSRLK